MDPKITRYKIDEILFTHGYPINIGPHTCKGGCCKSGAYTDISEKEKIEKYKDAIIQIMDDTQNIDPGTWFEKDNYDDNDFVSGKCTGTEIFNEKCVFLNRDNYCVLQIASQKLNKDKWFLKPLFCILFPLAIVDNTLTYDDYQNGNHACCTVNEFFDIPLFKACEEEITYLFGNESFEYLDKCYLERIKKAD